VYPALEADLPDLVRFFKSDGVESALDDTAGERLFPVPRAASTDPGEDAGRGSWPAKRSAGDALTIGYRSAVSVVARASRRGGASLIALDGALSIDGVTTAAVALEESRRQRRGQLLAMLSVPRTVGWDRVSVEPPLGERRGPERRAWPRDASEG
jgi:hypothetical protein